MTVDTNLMARYVALTMQKRQLKKDLDDAASQLDELEDRLAGQMLQNEMDATRVAGSTLYLQHEVQVSAKDGDQPRLHSVLGHLGMDDFVTPTVSTSRLKAWCRERIQDGDPIPPLLEGALNVHQRTRVRVRKA